MSIRRRKRSSCFATASGPPPPAVTRRRTAAPGTRLRRRRGRAPGGRRRGRRASCPPRRLAHEAADDGVRLAERHAAGDQVLGEIGRAERRDVGGGLMRSTSKVAARSSRRRAETGATVDGVEQQLLVLLQIPVVGERQALEGRRSPARWPIEPPALPRAARRCRGSSSAGASTSRWRRRRRGEEPELVVDHSTQLLAEAREVDAEQRDGEERLGDEVAVRRRVEGVLEGGREAELRGVVTQVQRQARTQPAHRRRAAGVERRRVGAGGRRRAPSAQAWASRWWASSTGWARCRWV